VPTGFSFTQILDSDIGRCMKPAPRTQCTLWSAVIVLALDWCIAIVGYGQINLVPDPD